jgi:hypothetical protein
MKMKADKNYHQATNVSTWQRWLAERLRERQPKRNVVAMSNACRKAIGRAKTQEVLDWYTEQRVKQSEQLVERCQAWWRLIVRNSTSV